MPRATRVTWAKRVDEWKQSGLDATTFAAKLGVTERTLKWWASRLAGERPRAPRKPKAITVPRDAATPALTFVEMTGVVRAEPIEIVLRTSTRPSVASSDAAPTRTPKLVVLERR